MNMFALFKSVKITLVDKVEKLGYILVAFMNVLGLVAEHLYSWDLTHLLV